MMNAVFQATIVSNQGREQRDGPDIKFVLTRSGTLLRTSDKTRISSISR